MTPQYLYVALTVTDGGIGAKSIGMYFDDDHDGLKDPGEDAILAFVGPGDTGARLLLQPAPGRSAEPLTTATRREADGRSLREAARIDVIAGGTEVGGQVTFELRHPLCSTDDVHDVCLFPGRHGRRALPVRDRRAFLLASREHRAFDPSDWGHLTVSRLPRRAGQIVFETTRDDGNHEIYRMNADGSAQTRLTNSCGLRRPAFDLAGRHAGRLHQRPRGRQRSTSTS